MEAPVSRTDETAAFGSLHGLILHGEDGALNGVVPPYLFVSSKQYEPFLETQRELAALNDYCVHLMNIEPNKGKTIPRDPTGKLLVQTMRENILDPVEQEFEEWVLQQEAEFLSFSISDTITLFNSASALTLLYFLMIKEMKSIGICYTPEKFRSIDFRKGGEFEKCIELLEHVTKTNLRDLIKNTEFKRALKKSRRIRNDFAHGNWSSLRKGLEGFSLVTAFEATSWFFSQVEDRFDESIYTKLA